MAEKRGRCLGQRTAAMFDFQYRQASLKDQQVVELLRRVGYDA